MNIDSEYMMVYMRAKVAEARKLLTEEELEQSFKEYELLSYLDHELEFYKKAGRFNQLIYFEYRNVPIHKTLSNSIFDKVYGVAKHQLYLAICNKDPKYQKAVNELSTSSTILITLIASNLTDNFGISSAIASAVVAHALLLIAFIGIGTFCDLEAEVRKKKEKPKE